MQQARAPGAKQPLAASGGPARARAACVFCLHLFVRSAAFVCDALCVCVWVPRRVATAAGMRVRAPAQQIRKTTNFKKGS